MFNIWKDQPHHIKEMQIKAILTDKTDRLNLIKINVYFAKHCLKRERQATNWEKIFANDMLKKGTFVQETTLKKLTFSKKLQE